MSLRQGFLARSIYLAAAYGTGWLFGRSGLLKTALARRSVGTGEIYFGRSDIDLALILQDDCVDGKSLQRLYQFHRLIGLLNPALGHVYPFREEDLETCASRDSIWGGMFAQSARHLWGRSVYLGVPQLEASHALRSFLTWVDAFVPLVVQRRDRRNCWKHALECWHYFALAQGLLGRTLVTRPQMLEHLQGFRPVPQDLDTPAGSVRFILELADELHRTRRSPVPKIQGPVVFRGIAAPHGLERTYVILPAPDSPLPPEAFEPGSFIATPELLDLYLQFKNGFLHWTVPADFGLEAPNIEGFLEDLLQYCAPHFLCWPGFVEPGQHPLNPAAKFSYLAHAFEWLSQGELPPQTTSGVPQRVTSVSDYYLNSYDQLRERTDILATEIVELLRN